MREYQNDWTFVKENGRRSAQLEKDSRKQTKGSAAYLLRKAP